MDKNLMIYLRDRNQKMVDEWQKCFADYEDVNISCGDIFHLPPDLTVNAIVSPANSFGYMDGGIDYYYSMYFGWKLSEDLRAYLTEHHDGELLIGQAVIIPTHNSRIPWLISAPTMRVPMNIAQTVNAYLAFRAVFQAVQRHNKKCRYGEEISSILCPGLGTAAGHMPARRCALQMRRAYLESRSSESRQFGTLEEACQHHYLMLDLEIDFVGWRLKESGKTG